METMVYRAKGFNKVQIGHITYHAGSSTRQDLCTRDDIEGGQHMRLVLQIIGHLRLFSGNCVPFILNAAVHHGGTKRSHVSATGLPEGWHIEFYNIKNNDYCL